VKPLLAAALASLALSAAAAEAEGGRLKVYALVAAMGDVFMATHEVRQTGSRLTPYRYSGIDAPDNILNRLVLAGLDEAIAKIEPASKRTHLAVAVPRPRTNTTRDDDSLTAVQVQLRDRPERAAWDRVVVATPAYRLQRTDAMAARTKGIGVFMQPLCQSEQGPCGMRGDGTSSSAAEKVQTPDGKDIRANQFVAPYVFVKIWILDPRTLEVTDSQEVFDYVKLWDPKADTMDLGEVIPKRELAKKIVELAMHATEEAVKRTELRGTVEVKDKGVVQ
jgi:hypothetical protein